MHDPLVVAHEIRRPWPRVSGLRTPTVKRWAWTVGSPFALLAGRRYYFPSLVTIWHREPDGRDAFEVCPHAGHWRWHVHHWHLQVPALQDLRRRLLTACAWCGGRSAPGDLVNFSTGWNAQPGPWWQGERNLFHRDCSAMPGALRACTCPRPLLEHMPASASYGHCLQCNRYRTPLPSKRLDRLRLLQRVPYGTRPNRIPDLREAVDG